MSRGEGGDAFLFDRIALAARRDAADVIDDFAGGVASIDLSRIAGTPTPVADFTGAASGAAVTEPVRDSCCVNPATAASLDPGPFTPDSIYIT